MKLKLKLCLVSVSQWMPGDMGSYCDLCNEKFELRRELWLHYCNHYENELRNISIDYTENDKGKDIKIDSIDRKKEQLCFKMKKLFCLLILMLIF